MIGKLPEFETMLIEHSGNNCFNRFKAGVSVITSPIPGPFSIKICLPLYIMEVTSPLREFIVTIFFLIVNNFIVIFKFEAIIIEL